MALDSGGRLALSRLLPHVKDYDDVKTALIEYDAVRRSRTLKQMVTARQAERFTTLMEEVVGLKVGHREDQSGNRRSPAGTESAVS